MNDYIFIIKKIILQHLQGTTYKVFLFGSRAAGKVQHHSDIDVGILGNQPLPVLLKTDIEEAIEESNVPYKVDIVDFFQVPENFKKSALKQTVSWN